MYIKLLKETLDIVREHIDWLEWEGGQMAYYYDLRSRLEELIEKLESLELEIK